MILSMKNAKAAIATCRMEIASDDVLKSEILEHAKAQGWLPADHTEWQGANSFNANDMNMYRVMRGTFYYNLPEGDQALQVER